MMNAQQHAERHHGDDQARAAVADQRQRESLCRQDTHVHAEVDEGLQAEPGTNTDRHVGFETAIRLDGTNSEPENTPQQRSKQADEDARPGQAELFGENGKDEIRVRLRQVEQLLNTVMNCLKSTCSKKFTSIAIPAISSGTLLLF